MFYIFYDILLVVIDSDNIEIIGTFVLNNYDTFKIL